MASARERVAVKSEAIPPLVATLLDALRFSGQAETPAPPGCEAEWKAALYYFGRNQLTLFLRLPGPRHEANLAKNRERIARIKEAFREVSAALSEANIEFAVLKGFANWNQFTPDPSLRMQYDLDLFCPVR